MILPLCIANRLISNATKPLVVAEMSGNHNQSLDRAFQIVDAAAKAGAEAIKLQTYTADTMTLDVRGGSFDINDPDSLWSGKNLHDLYKLAYTPWEWHKPIMDYAKNLGLICFSSPFDESAVDFLESLDVPAYKIASFENNHLPLIEKAASTGKPLIISTGMASIAELGESVKVARDAGCKDLILLKCTSTYPADPSNSNINTIPHMRELFDCEVGLSDHTLGFGAAVASVALGSVFIEKHFTLSRADGGVDSAFSLEPNELELLIKETSNAWMSRGKVTYGMTNSEKDSVVFRRSLYVIKDIEKGEKITSSNVGIIRPGDGAPPLYFKDIIGLSVCRCLKKGTPFSLDFLGE